jgi:hypothetical protein
VVAEAKQRGYVETLAGRRIPLAADEPNYNGKAVNRVVQGTAADIFNRAAVAVNRAIGEQGLPAAVALLIFDELWVEADDPGEEIIALVRATMEAAAEADGVRVPVRIEEPGSQEGSKGGEALTMTIVSSVTTTNPSRPRRRSAAGSAGDTPRGPSCPGAPRSRPPRPRRVPKGGRDDGDDSTPDAARGPS